MILHFQIGGFGLTFQILHFDLVQFRTILLGWGIMKKYEFWRRETHAIGEGSYRYTCIKNGKTVEDFTLRSPINNHV